MIGKREQKKMKKVLGRNYVSEVKAKLTARGIQTTNGKDYSPSTIRNVFVGNLENFYIEQAIIDVYQEKQKRLLAYEKKKQKLLS